MTSLEFVKGYSRNTKNKKSRAKLSILYFLYYSKDRSSRGLTIHNIIFIEDLVSNTKKSLVAVKSLKKITDEKKT